MRNLRIAALLPTLALAITIGACSSSGEPTAGQQTPTPSNAGHAPAVQDIPDNQVYLVYQGAGFVIKYPEGWTQTATTSGVVFNNLDSQISVSVRSGPAPDIAAATAEARSISGATLIKLPQATTLPGGPAIAYTFGSTSSPDAVTGKSTPLVTDRYEVAGTAGRGFAVIDLSSPVGVDNVDAFRLISQAFAWR